MNYSTANIDDSFGPVYAQYLDFTRLFEDAIFAILPSALFLCILPWRVSWLLQEPRKVSGSALHAGKIVCFPNLFHDQSHNDNDRSRGRETRLRTTLIYPNR